MALRTTPPRATANVDRQEVHLIQTSGGNPLGELSRPLRQTPAGQGRGHGLRVEARPELADSDAISHSRPVGQGEELAAKDAKQELQGFAFVVGDQHPVFEVSRAWLPHPETLRLVPASGRLPAFLRLIQPVLERRLAGSPLVGHTGEVKISFYRSGIKLGFEAGALSKVEPWQPTVEDEGSAAFPISCSSSSSLVTGRWMS